MAAATYVLIAFAIFLFVYGKQLYEFIKKRRRLIQHVDQLPGPYSIPLLGTTWQFKWDTTQLALQMRAWGIFYGGEGHQLIRLWIGPRPMVLCIRPEAAKFVLESNSLITKSLDYDILIPWLGTGLLIATGDKWQRRRKMLTPSFHFKMLNGFLFVHDEQTKIFLEQIDQFADTNKSFDIFPYIKRCALDIICETAMGCTVSAQTDHNNPYVVAVQRMNELAFMWQRMPWMRIKSIWYLSGKGYEYEKNLKILTDFTRKVIDDKIRAFEESGGQSDGQKTKAFLDMLVELQAEGQLNYEDIREEVDTFMFEGHDTTSASLGWTLFLLAHNPHVQDKIIQEVDEIFGQSGRDCTTEDLKEMKYVERCIKESLRMRPSVPNLARQATEDFDINGVTVPAGCTVVVAPQMLHMHQATYEEPLRYDPDRFTEENIAKRHPYSYVPFSAGPRNCIGQKFALMEEKTVISWFFRRYRISSDLSMEENIPLPEIILRPNQGFPVKIHRR